MVIASRKAEVALEFSWLKKYSEHDGSLYRIPRDTMRIKNTRDIIWTIMQEFGKHTKDDMMLVRSLDSQDYFSSRACVP